MPVLLPRPAAVTALRTLGVRHMALLHPPWFADDEQQLGMAYFRTQGCEVVYANQLRLRGLPVAQPTDPLRTFTDAVSRGAVRMRARRCRPRPKRFS